MPDPSTMSTGELADHIIETAARVREYQRRYFALRRQRDPGPEQHEVDAALQTSRTAERILDEALGEYEARQQGATGQQASLLGDL